VAHVSFDVTRALTGWHDKRNKCQEEKIERKKKPVVANADAEFCVPLNRKWDKGKKKVMWVGGQKPASQLLVNVAPASQMN